MRRFRRRHYEFPAAGQGHELPAEEPAPLQELGRLVFLVLLRAVGPEHASMAKVCAPRLAYGTRYVEARVKGRTGV